MSIRVLGICGSLRPNSNTGRAVLISLSGAKFEGADVSYLDLAELGLPFCDGRDDLESYPENVQRLRKEIENAQGIILGTPDYHNSLTGALKNALDFCGRTEFEHKMVGVIGVAGGSMDAINSINHLRIIMRAVGAWVVPNQVSISNSAIALGNGFGDENVVIVNRLKKLGADVTKFARLIVAGVIDTNEIGDM